MLQEETCTYLSVMTPPLPSASRPNIGLHVRGSAESTAHGKSAGGENNKAIHRHTHKQKHAHNTCSRMHTHKHSTHAQVHTNTHKYTNTHAYTHAYTHSNENMHAYVPVCENMCRAVRFVSKANCPD